MIKRIGIGLAAVLPALGLALWLAFPGADPVLKAPIFHFYIVSFTTFAATVVSLFVAISAGQTALPSHLLLAVAFAWMGAVFFLHGVTTTGAVIAHFHPALSWSAWLTLFGGSAIFVMSTFATDIPDLRFVRLVAAALLVAYLIYAAIAALAPDLLSLLLSTSPPAAATTAFGLTLALWAISSVQHYRRYRQTHNFLDGLMAFEAIWFTTATLSMFGSPVFGIFPLWNASWWLYHVLLLAGFLVAIYALWRAYEQVRAFSLSRYFAATSLIVTAGLALLSAHLYSEQTFSSLLDQLEGSAATISRNLADALAMNLPQATADDSLRRLGGASGAALDRQRVIDQSGAPQQVSLYDADGRAVFSTEAHDIGLSLRGTPQFHHFQAALAGSTAFFLYEPGQRPATPPDLQNVYLLETYVPFRPAGDPQAAPIGVLTTVLAAPELGQSLIVSRQSSIALAALSMGGLFLVLLIIVRRADQIITNRAHELGQAYADLRRAEGLRDDLTNMIVHDLRNPLTAITVNLDLLNKTLSTPTSAETAPRLLTRARAAGQRMLGMIDDLLNVSKFEAGELRPVLASLHLQGMLVEKESSYQAQAEKEEKTFTLHAPANLPSVPADGNLVGRVVDNLVSNAFKYTDRGGHIKVMVEHAEDTLLVHVRDDGQGIPDDYHDRIFEKFVQVTDDSGAPLRKGTGLGLAFCRLAVEAHGGRIWVVSVPGQGSTFSFTLPLEQNLNGTRPGRGR